MTGLEAGGKVRKESRTPRFLAWENGWWVVSFKENGNIKRLETEGEMANLVLNMLCPE